MNSNTPRPQDRTFDSNGVSIRYIVQGSGPAIVLLHGLTGGLDHWFNVGYYDGPFEGYQLIAMDCRGHGQSGKPHDPAAYGLEMVNDIVRLLDHLGLSKAHLVGHSMGAEITLKWVTRCAIFRFLEQQPEGPGPFSLLLQRRERLAQRQ